MWHFPWKINRHDKSPIRLWHVEQFETTKFNQSKDNTWHINWPLKHRHMSKANSFTTMSKTTFRQKGLLMVNQKLNHLQFVHSVIQVQKDHSRMRRSSKCKKVVQHGSTWTTSQHLEIIRITLCSRTYDSDFVLLFWSMSKILVYHYNF